jgi:hypothetical protein
MKIYSAALIGAGLIFAAAQPASACMIYDTLNGTTGFPGTNVGMIGAGASDVCQIGDLSATAQGNAVVAPGSTPSNYEFQFAGGVMTIMEELGNNGTEPGGIDVDLDSLASQTSTSPSAVLASMHIPFSSGPSGEFTLISSQVLAAGWYTLSNFAGDSSIDPRYQANFTVAVPEPSSLALLIASLIGLAVLGRRREDCV